MDSALSDKKLHSILDKLNPELRSKEEIDGKKRVREFYAMTPEDAYAILEAIAEINGYTHRLKKWNATAAEKIEETEQLVMHIKDAMEEQNSGSQQIGEALHIMNDTTSEVKAASHEMSEGNRSILDEIRNLQNATDAMKESMQKIVSGADKINQSGNELNEIAPQMKSSIDQISNQIDQFRV